MPLLLLPHGQTSLLEDSNELPLWKTSSTLNSLPLPKLGQRFYFLIFFFFLILCLVSEKKGEENERNFNLKFWINLVSVLWIGGILKGHLSHCMWWILQDLLSFAPLFVNISGKFFCFTLHLLCIEYFFLHQVSVGNINYWFYIGFFSSLGTLRGRGRFKI